jgi:mitotic spindle assembly checkpoint protein MAD1
MRTLFGYKVDVLSNGKQYKLRSIYAEDKDEILFQIGPQGRLDLLATDFTLGLTKEIHTYLEQCNSIPAFLSNVTVELFNARTFQE